MLNTGYSVATAKGGMKRVVLMLYSEEIEDMEWFNQLCTKT